MHHTSPNQTLEVKPVDIFFMGSMPKEGQPITLNGAFHVNTQIVKFVVASAAEAELGALF